MLEIRFKNKPLKAYFHFTSHDNETISKEWLEAKREEYYAMGEGHAWEREYMARFVRGGKNAVLPMLTEYHFEPHAQIIQRIKKDRHHMIWQAVADPGTTTVFAVLFSAYDPHNRILYLLDEIYEESMANTTTGKIIPQVKAKRLDLSQKTEWQCSYDEAAAWFAAEVMGQFPDETWVPTQKHLNKPEDQLSKIKDLLLRNQMVISDRCKKWRWEAYNFILDGVGRLPRKQVHLMDTTRYTTDFLTPFLLEPKQIEIEDQRRGFSLDDDRSKIQRLY